MYTHTYIYIFIVVISILNKNVMLYNIKYIIHINVYYNIINYFTSYINMKVIKHKTCKEKICIS